MGNELADHLAVIFKYLALLEPDEILAQQLVEHCLVPVLQKMNDSFKRDRDIPNPYAQVLRAILNVLKQVQQSVPVTLGKLDGNHSVPASNETQIPINADFH